MRSALVVVVIVSIAITTSITTATSVAFAADAGLGDSKASASVDSNDPAALFKKLTDEHAALSTSDCNDACRALGSIRRAAEKICTIEPGPRCESARDKAADATRRVQAACPDCALAAGPIRAESPPQPVPATQGGSDKTANAPPREESKGGCASCSSVEGRGANTSTDLGMIAVAAFVATRLFRRTKAKKHGR